LQRHWNITDRGWMSRMLVALFQIQRNSSRSTLLACWVTDRLVPVRQTAHVPVGSVSWYL